MKRLRIGQLLTISMMLIGLTVVAPFVQSARAVNIDIAPIEEAIKESIAAGVDKESAVLNAASEAAEEIYAVESLENQCPEDLTDEEKKDLSCFDMTVEQLTEHIIAMLGTSDLKSYNEETLVIDIIPIEEAINAAVAEGADREDAIQEVVGQAAEEIYIAETEINPDFGMTVEEITADIIAMLGTGDIEAYEENKPPVVIGLAPLEIPSSPI